MLIPTCELHKVTLILQKKDRKIQDFVWTGARDLLVEAKTIDIGKAVTCTRVTGNVSCTGCKRLQNV